MKYAVMVLLILALAGVAFLFGPVMWLQAKNVCRTGKGKFGSFQIEINGRNSEKAVKITADNEANEAFAELKESLAEVDSGAREFRADIESMISGMGRNIGEMEKHLRRGRVRVDKVCSALGSDAAGAAKVEALKQAQAKREDLMKALQDIKSRMAKAAEEWESLIAGTGPIELGAEPYQPDKAETDPKNQAPDSTLAPAGAPDKTGLLPESESGQKAEPDSENHGGTPWTPRMTDSMDY